MDKYLIINFTIQLIGIVFCITGILSGLSLNRQVKGSSCASLMLIFVFMAVSSAGNIVASFGNFLNVSCANTVVFTVKFFAIGCGYWYVVCFNRYMKFSLNAKSKTMDITCIVVTVLSALMTASLFGNIFGKHLYSVVGNKYLRGKFYYLSPLYEGVILLLDIVLIFLHRKSFKRHDFIVFLLYTFLPVSGTVMQVAWGKISFLDMAIVLGSIVLLLNRQTQITERLIEEQQKVSEQKEQVARLKEKNVISQIQPHFIYNTLTAISGIDKMPEKAQEAIIDFSKFLRENLESLSSADLVPFDKELDHIQKYVRLEKLRFGEKVNVVINVKFTDFLLPSLTVQMLVENAIKHGITKKYEGGNVEISTYKTENAVIITVKDDGVGFDTTKKTDEKSIGISSIKNRLDFFVGGTLNVESKPGKGTKATITIPLKNQNEKENAL